MRSSTLEAMELLKSWAATKASVRFIFSSKSLAAIRSPKVPFLVVFDEALDRLSLSGEGWSLEFVLSSADLSTFLITEDESPSLMFKFPDANLQLFTFKAVLDTGGFLQ